MAAPSYGGPEPLFFIEQFLYHLKSEPLYNTLDRSASMKNSVTARITVILLLQQYGKEIARD